jgi:GNAT superfamily N-acetyltransferase
MELSELQFGHHQTRSGLHQVTARQGSQVVGGLQWYPDADKESGIQRGEIATVAVLPEHQGHGIASHMLNHARELSNDNPDVPYPQHSTSRSAAGTGWAAKTGGRIPRNVEPQSTFSDDSTRSLVNSMAKS